jgi:hypothetical protein
MGANQSSYDSILAKEEMARIKKANAINQNRIKGHLATDDDVVVISVLPESCETVSYPPYQVFVNLN